MHIKFNAFEYTADDKFVDSEYEYSGDKNSGWEIKRNGSDYLRLGSGYELLKTKKVKLKINPFLIRAWSAGLSK